MKTSMEKLKERFDTLQKFLQTTKNVCGYNGDTKETFKTLSMSFLRQLKKVYNLDADIRFLTGGNAVSGDSILHSDTAYICVSAYFDWWYARSVKSKKDFNGGINKIIRNTDSFEDFVKTFEALLNPEKSAPTHLYLIKNKMGDGTIKIINGFFDEKDANFELQALQKAWLTYFDSFTVEKVLVTSESTTHFSTLGSETLSIRKNLFS